MPEVAWLASSLRGRSCPGLEAEIHPLCSSLLRGQAPAVQNQSTKSDEKSQENLQGRFKGMAPTCVILWEVLVLWEEAPAFLPLTGQLHILSGCLDNSLPLGVRVCVREREFRQLPPFF